MIYSLYILLQHRNGLRILPSKRYNYICELFGWFNEFIVHRLKNIAVLFYKDTKGLITLSNATYDHE